MEFDELSNKVIGCAVEVHRHLGPGLLESAYERCLSFEFSAAGIRHEAQKEFEIDYKGVLVQRDIWQMKRDMSQMKRDMRQMKGYLSQIERAKRLVSCLF